MHSNMISQSNITTSPVAWNRRVASSPSGTVHRTKSRNNIEKDAEEELLFLTDISRTQTTLKSTCAEDLDRALDKTPCRFLQPHEVRTEIYRRECQRLNVVPLSTYIKIPIRPSLVVQHCSIGPRGALALSAPLLLDNNITHLDLTGNFIGAGGLRALLTALDETMRVTHLNLSENNLGSQGASLLCDSVLKSCVFEYLSLSDNQFKDEDAVKFAQVLEASKCLRELVLSHNHFEDIAGPALGNALGNNDRLEALDISWNHIRKKSAVEFSRGVKHNVGLKKLDIRFNGLGTEGAFGFADALRKNRTLTELDLSHNRIIDMDAAVLKNSITVNDTLKVLRIGDNQLTQDGAYFLLQSLENQESGNVVDTLDLKNTCVDQDFVYLAEKIQQMRNVQIIHGKVVTTGRLPQNGKKRKLKQITEETGS